MANYCRQGPILFPIQRGGSACEGVRVLWDSGRTTVPSRPKPEGAKLEKRQQGLHEVDLANLVPGQCGGLVLEVFRKLALSPLVHLLYLV